MNNQLTKQPHPGVNLLRRLLNMPERKQTNEEWWAWYTEYLQSPEWQRRADRCKERARWTCQDCGARGVVLQAHHTTYERVGNERDSDLVCLCEGCHKGRHRSE